MSKFSNKKTLEDVFYELLVRQNYYVEKIEKYDKESKGVKDGYCYLEDSTLEEITFEKLIELYSNNDPFIVRMKRRCNEDTANLHFNHFLRKYGVMYLGWFYDNDKKPQKFERIGIDGEILETVIPGENLFKNLIKKIFHRNN